MSSKNKQNLLRQVKDLIDEIGGIEESQYLNVGVTFSELLEPTKDTIKKLKDYKSKINTKDEEIERLDFYL